MCVAIGDELSYEFFSKVIVANIQHLLHTDSILSTIPKGKMTIFSILYLLSIIQGDKKKKKKSQTYKKTHSRAVQRMFGGLL